VAVSFLVMIVDRARATARYRSDRGSGSTARKPANRRAARGANTYALDCLANVMMAAVDGMVMVIFVIVDRRGGSRY